jgi:uncharacterized Zn finger protein
MAAASEPSRPLPAAGLKPADGEGGWWSQRFIALLESFGLGSRLERGRDYARSGQVLELEIEPGIALAKVQGSRYTPYRVRVRGKPLSDHQWHRAERALAAQALPLAQLLAGRMPPDIEELLAACKLTLFPASYEALKASCECADAETPCKHIAAVCYLLAERFDADPFLIFAWRGRPPDELLDGLRRRRGRPRSRPKSSTDAGSLTAPAIEPASFWSSASELAELQVSPLAGEAPDALLRRLGPAPVDAGGRDVADVLAEMHRELARAAERRALGE